MATKSIATHRVARPDAGALEAAQIVAADKEPILNENVLGIPTKYIAGLTGDAQHPFGKYRVIVAGSYFVAYVIDPEPDPSEVIAQRGVIAAGRIKPIVATVVEQNLADFGGYVLTRLKYNEQLRVGLQVGNIVGSRGVFQRLSQILGDLITGAERATVRKLLVRRGHATKEIRRWAGLDFKNVEARGDVAGARSL